MSNHDELKSELQALTNRVCTLESLIRRVIAEKREAGEVDVEQPAKRKIDMSKLPVDTPVLGRDFPRDLPVPGNYAGNMNVWTYGADSRTAELHSVSAGHWNMISIDFDACKPVFWLGGEQPVPDGIVVSVWLRNGDTYEGDAAGFNWVESSFGVADLDIIGYQMIRISEGWEE